MCQICESSPCLMGCPNQEDKPVAKCDSCGEIIYEGDVLYKYGDKKYCCCLDDMSSQEFIEFFGIKQTIARAEYDT